MARGEGIQKLSSYFEHYRKKLIAPQRTIIQTFIEVVEDLYGWQVDETVVAYDSHSKTLTVRGGPLKTEVQLHKVEILNHLKGRLGEKNSPKTIL